MEKSEVNGQQEKMLSDDNSESDCQAVLSSETQFDKHTEGKTNPCRWCSSPLPVAARVCPTCKGHQKWIWNYFSQVLLVVSTCISVVLVCISAANVYLTKSNLDAAKEERIRAKDALDIAQSASKEALKAQAVASAAQSVLNDLSLVADANTAAVSASHDIDALRKLWAMSRNTNDRVRGIAEKQLKPIISQLRTDHEVITSDYWGFKPKQDPQYYGFNKMEGWKRTEYIKNYVKVPDDRRVVYVMQFLSDEKETEEEKFAFCYSALQLESRPDVIYALCAFIDAKAKLYKDYLFETDYYLTWLNAQRGVSPDR
jgi:hypothetical protein